ncbi:MAG: alpha/beta hydrolase family protein [bacterium]
MTPYARRRLATPRNFVLPLITLAFTIAGWPSSGTSPSTPKPSPELVSIPAGELTLYGYLYKPEGAGPFPVVVWNHGSEKMPGWQPDLAEFCTDHVSVFLIPHRHGHGQSPGDDISDLIDDYRAHETDRARVEKKAVEFHELYNKNVVAAVEWLKKQPFVDACRIVMTDVSYGGIQTLLTAEKELGIRAFNPFAPGAMSRSSTEIQQRLLRAAQNAKAPMFLIQARNDYSTGPSEVLGPAHLKHTPTNQAKLYPPFGSTHMDGHRRFATKPDGIAIWGEDVLSFIRRALESGQ